MPNRIVKIFVVISVMLLSEEKRYIRKRALAQCSAVETASGLVFTAPRIGIFTGVGLMGA
jgi:hypothetical protein